MALTLLEAGRSMGRPPKAPKLGKIKVKRTIKGKSK